MRLNRELWKRWIKVNNVLVNILGVYTFVPAILIFFLGLFSLMKGAGSKVNKAFFYFNLTIFVWLFFYSLAYFSGELTKKLIFFKAGYVGITCIPILWYYFTLKFLQENRKLFKIIFDVGACLAVCFVGLNLFTKFFIAGLLEYDWGYYPKVFVLSHVIFLTYFNVYFTLSAILPK